MTAQHLGGQRIDDIVKIEALLFCAKLGVIDHLKKQVAELAGQFIEGATLDGVGHFVSLFQRVGHDAVPILLDVPWTALLSVAQHGH